MSKVDRFDGLPAGAEGDRIAFGEGSALPVPASTPPDGGTSRSVRTADDGQETAVLEDVRPVMRHPLLQDLMISPTSWRLWPAVAILRWVQRQTDRWRQLVYRSYPSLSFAASEIKDIALGEERIEVTLNVMGLATAGSPLPSSDIDRIIADARAGGALNAWLDGICDLFMHVIEDAQHQVNAAFATATGGRVAAHAMAADMVGRSAALAAEPGGVLHDAWSREPEGAVGLAGLFLGPISAAGLSSLISAFTCLPAEVREFAGAEISNADPVRIGRPPGRMLGSRCHLPSAGVEVHIHGGRNPIAQEWARDPVRRRSLHFLASAYVGASPPMVRIVLWLDAGNAPPAALDGESALGGLAVMGGAVSRTRLPLETGTEAPHSRSRGDRP